jgi:hypothetical protein
MSTASVLGVAKMMLLQSMDELEKERFRDMRQS